MRKNSEVFLHVPNWFPGLFGSTKLLPNHELVCSFPFIALSIKFTLQCVVVRPPLHSCACDLTSQFIMLFVVVMLDKVEILTGLFILGKWIQLDQGTREMGCGHYVISYACETCSCCLLSLIQEWDSQGLCSRSFLRCDHQCHRTCCSTPRQLHRGLDWPCWSYNCKCFFLFVSLYYIIVIMTYRV